MVIVVFKKRLSSKPEMAIFENINVDDILNGNKRKPLIPYKWHIEEVGVGGEELIASYEKSFKISKKSLNPVF